MNKLPKDVYQMVYKLLYNECMNELYYTPANNIKQSFIEAGIKPESINSIKWEHLMVMVPNIFIDNKAEGSIINEHTVLWIFTCEWVSVNMGYGPQSRPLNNFLIDLKIDDKTIDIILRGNDQPETMTSDGIYGWFSNWICSVKYKVNNAHPI